MIKIYLKGERTILVELLSAVSFFFMSIVLMVTAPYPYFLGFVLLLFSLFQFAGIIYKFDMMLMRICMAWIAGSVWSAIALFSLNTTILYIPVLVIGIFNFYAFVTLTNRANLDWVNFFKE